jgi:hypothetical protein
MFAVESTKSIVWNDETTSYIVKSECISDDDDDINWRLSQFDEDSSSDDEDSDLLWCTSSATIDTWGQRLEFGTKVSKRVKYQLMPL